MTMPFAATAASTKRAQLVDGRRGAPSTYLTGLICTPPDPADPGWREELRQQGFETPHRLLEVFLEGTPDIAESDRFVVDGNDFAVRAVARWPQAGSLPAYTHLLLEDEATR
jgi:hypothetical protein